MIVLLSRFHLCMWYKDNPKSIQNYDFYLARMRSKAIVRHSWSTPPWSRDTAKKVTLALGQHSSFSRGFDKILYMLLVSNFCCFIFFSNIVICLTWT